jgi:hypothetical protein
MPIADEATEARRRSLRIILMIAREEDHGTSRQHEDLEGLAPPT